MDDRCLKFKELRKQGLTLQEIGHRENPSLSAERIRQILLNVKYKFCRIHNTRFLLVCQYCYHKKLYAKNLRKLKDDYIQVEGKRLSTKDRSLYLTIQRVLFIRKIKDKKKMSFGEIAKLLHRDHSSILNLYHNKKI